MNLCDVADLYAYGLPRGSISNPGRLIDRADVGTEALTLDMHGFISGDPVTFRAEDGGSLPEPLAEGVTYYAIPVDDHRFRVSETTGGSAVNLTTAGERFIVVARFPAETAIAWASAIVLDSLPAHVLPIDPSAIPPIVRMTAAELAVWKLQGMHSPTGRTIGEAFDFAQKRLARWAKGAPVRGEASPPRAQRSAAATVPYIDRTGWRTKCRGGNLL